MLALLILGLFSCEPVDNVSTFEGYDMIVVDGGDLSGERQAGVVVDIGFGDREYYAFTNEYGQLVRVEAKEIILQDDDTEPVLSSGRYYKDEAKVPGVESPVLDEGHIIADSLGGVANAYNITPQDSTLNRHGDQAYMEDAIRQAGGCTDFVAIITYPNTETQIPSAYSYTYTINGQVISDSFENINPDELNDYISDSDIIIQSLDKKAEVIVLENISQEDVNLEGWQIVSVRGDQTYTFDSYVLKANTTVTIGDGNNNVVDLHWLDGNGTWSNSKSDPAELYNKKGILVDKFLD